MHAVVPLRTVLTRRSLFSSAVFGAFIAAAGCDGTSSGSAPGSPDSGDSRVDAAVGDASNASTDASSQSQVDVGADTGLVDASIQSDASDAASGDTNADAAAALDVNASAFDANAIDSSSMDANQGDTDGATSSALQRSPSGGWSTASGDPNNPTSGVIAAYGDGVVIAGASSDPSMAGLAQFPEAGTYSEAFLRRIAHDGTPLWSVPLSATGTPKGIGVDPSGNIIVTAPQPPPTTTVTTYSGGQAFYLGKFTSFGSAVFEKQIILPGLGSNDGSFPAGLAVDSTGASYVTGSLTYDTGAQGVFLYKADPTGAEVWSKMIQGDTNGAEMVGAAVAAVAQDEVVIGGSFEGHADFGGGQLFSEPDGGFIAPGFVVRYAPDGGYVSSAIFMGYSGFSQSSALAAATGTDVLVSGMVEGAASVGGIALTGDATLGSAFIARLGRNGTASWATLIAGAPPSSEAYSIAVDALGRAHVAGALGGSLVVADYDSSDGGALPNLTAQVSDAGSGVMGISQAIDSTQSLWISGSFDTSATFGNITLSGTSAGVFLVRIDPGGP